MDEESRQLLREIRDAALRDEALNRRMVWVASVAAAVMMAAIALVIFRFERLMTVVEGVPAPAVAPR